MSSPRLRTSFRDVGAAVAAILFHPRLLLRGLELLGLAIRDFFLPQYQSVIARRLRAVVTIAHPLDELIPFDPPWVRAYSGFIALWLEGLGGLFRRFGAESLSDIDRSIAGLCRIYRTAGGVYKRCQTTTVRPPAPLLSPRFQLIRIFDPHLHCIPSLHVAITCYAWLSLRERVGGRGDGVQELAARAYRGVLQVIRSILLVKQHSLADIGPSLFMVTALFPEYGEQWVVDLAGDLLSLMPGTRAALGVRLRDTVLTDYRELREWSGDSSGPQEAVLSYIRRWSAPGNRPAAQQPPP